mmetsp:Transcript_21356/g.39867  ORF Transcript_21356/g.39867 Transcript_21356/m.39867 type:complete len:113 (+) Transcript_21356:576-914(+)
MIGGTGESLFLRRFHVASPRLEILDVTGLSKGVFISCTCPNLRRFACLGYCGNGSRPVERVAGDAIIRRLWKIRTQKPSMSAVPAKKFMPQKKHHASAWMSQVVAKLFSLVG